jgi:class 3 adenylate cyclase
MDMASVEQMADLRTDFEVSQKQLEVDLLNQQKRTQRIIMYSLGFAVLLITLFYRKISQEKNRSDLLLLNILPSKTAKELKEKGKVEARKFESVTVMFTDFEAFTQHSQDLTPEKLVKSVDHYFSAFDKIIEKYHLEKIKTIGDAYMCTGGLIRKGPLEPVKVIRAAFEIIDFVQKADRSNNEDLAHFRIRIGINTGPVVGGVVGTKKFAYDIWGDTVNVAARMENNSEANRINISENTYQLVKDRFECEYRGEIDVKNKGMMKMYFVHGPKKDESRLESKEVRKTSSVEA